MICQASRILLACCPWLSVIIGWITDVTRGKRQLCFKKHIWVLNSFCLRELDERKDLAFKRSSKTETRFILNMWFRNDAKTRLYQCHVSHCWVNENANMQILFYSM